MNEVKPMKGLRCPLILDSKDVSYSLVDYRNSRFTSQNPDKIIDFYDSFKNRDDLIEWMKERPKGVAYIHEVDGDKNIIVVIPTADFNGRYARECRENIFKGLHIIFVESGGRGDFYFNVAYYVNVGIKKAMEYDPKWVVYSGDDMLKVDSVLALNEGLRKIDASEVGIVFCSPGSNYHSKEMYISAIKKVRYIINPLLPFRQRKAFEINRKFGTTFLSSDNSFLKSLLYRKIFKFKNTIAFGIYSAEMIRDFVSRDGYLFDETFINCGEEGDLAIRIQKSKWKLGEVKFRIEPIIGGTLGQSVSRYLRDQAGVIYMSSKIEKFIDARRSSRLG